MRPLFRDSKFNFFINGHYKFSESGASENPRIGTTEDWFFINAMLGPIPLPHPMHIHLITFQVLQRGQLKILARYIVNNVTTECTFYEIDYYKKAGYQFPNSSNLTDCCFQIR
jgi:FtsP/CotA-like multicopper oxidase with cupredoxin domain